MRSLIFIFSIICVLSINTFGQNNTDTTKSKKCFYNFGASISMTADRFVNTTLADFAQKLSSLSYSTNYYKIDPQFTFIFIVGKHCFLNKVELALSHIRARYKYTYTHQNNPWDPNVFHSGTYDIENTYHFIDLKDKVGIKYKRFCFYGGLYVSYLISGMYYLDAVSSADDNYWELHIKNHFRYGAECEINCFISKHWYFGVGSNISNGLKNEEKASFFKKYQVLSFQFTVGAKFIKDRTFN